MFCPKCGATLKEGAKFCHVCGFNMEEIPVKPMPQYQPVTPPSQPNDQQTEGPGFDISKTPISSWIIAGAATFGALCTFLPWTFFWYFNLSVLVFFIFIGIAGLAIFGDVMKMQASVRDKIISFGGIGAAGFCFIDFLRSLASFYPRPGFGLIMAMMSAVAVILFGFKIIKLK